MSDLGSQKSQLIVQAGSMAEAAEILQKFDEQKQAEELRVIPERVHVPLEKVERAIQFWRPIYFSMTKEGRCLNGVEAFELGDEKLNNKSIYIAMCNLMALEAIKRMGDDWPSVHADNVHGLALGTDREKEIADFWHKTFAPTLTQSGWAWAACLAVLRGAPAATAEMLENYREQLP